MPNLVILSDSEESPRRFFKVLARKGRHFGGIGFQPMQHALKWFRGENNGPARRGAHGLEAHATEESAS